MFQWLMFINEWLAVNIPSQVQSKIACGMDFSSEAPVEN
jgi:hypothetical protein